MKGTSFTPVQRKFHGPVVDTDVEHEVVKYVPNNTGKPESNLLSNEQIVMLQELVDHDMFSYILLAVAIFIFLTAHRCNQSNSFQKLMQIFKLFSICKQSTKS